MRNLIHIAATLLVVIVAAACAPAGGENIEIEATAVTAENGGSADAMPARMGPGSGMMARHRAQVPEEYAGLVNPVPPDEESLTRGAAIYDQYCTACHGDGGMGDGPAGQQLDPPPAPVAHTSRMLGDDYMFWRVSEGGGHEPFTSAMPRWQDVLNDTDRWDVINYIRSLGSGTVMPGGGPGGGLMFDPAEEARRHQEIAIEGVAQGVLTLAEADAFISIHAQLDRMTEASMEEMSGGMETMQQEMLARLVAEGVVTQAEADAFNAAHDKLLAAGLME